MLPVGHVEGAEVDEGHEDDEDVEVAPAAVCEGGEPVYIYIFI